IAGKLPQRSIVWARLPAAADDKATAAKTVFAQAQERLQLGLYGRAAELFSTDWGIAEVAPIRAWFRKRVYTTDMSAHTWNVDRLLKFEPRQALENGDGVVLIVADGNQVRPIEMIQ